MTETLPLQPLETSRKARRKSRVCTREACECCREKKAKCDGEKPCSRCVSRGLKCLYRTRVYKTKRSLQVELDQFKEANHELEAIIKALAAPETTSEALTRLRNGELMGDVAEALGTTSDGTCSGDSSLANDSQSVTPKPCGHLFCGPLPPRVIPAVTNEPWQAEFPNHISVTNPDSSHIQDPIDRLNMGGRCAKGKDVMMPTSDTEIFGNDWVTHGGPEGVGPTTFDFAPQNEMFRDNQYMNTYTNGQYSSQPYSTDDLLGAVNWWTPDEVSLSIVYGPTMFFDVMNNQTTRHNPMPPVSSVAASSAAQSPIAISSSPGIGPSSCHRPSISSKATEGEFAVQTPTGTQDYRPSPAVTILPTLPPSANVNTPDLKPTSSRRSESCLSETPAAQPKDRHRSPTSARSWEKQKRQAAELEAIKNEVEARHKHLKAEYNDLLGEVVSVKSQLMDHARCNHPAISSWLWSQASNYVLKGRQERKNSSISISSSSISSSIQHHRPSISAAATTRPRGDGSRVS